MRSILLYCKNQFFCDVIYMQEISRDDLVVLVNFIKEHVGPQKNCYPITEDMLKKRSDLNHIISKFKLKYGDQYVDVINDIMEDYVEFKYGGVLSKIVKKGTKVLKSQAVKDITSQVKSHATQQVKDIASQTKSRSEERRVGK